ncbi:helix-turn-helix domain-containing protein [Tabrizicola sp.]|uniref:helix-turn-helix domain-containing protein n=1 Tax=Tabrizicola sp. TaxID=2005166 RepID=UPI0027366718|nr:XRE family transcriptional regulator [Tabrizicola sp.]MDP3194077.1 XRE family transcriptional regulator [Tabrizicola sp.]
MAPLTDRPRSIEPHLELAGRIRRWREARGWNQQALAERSGFARSTLSKIENGLLSPTFEILLKLAQGFDCDLSDLVRAEPVALVGRMVVERGTPGAAIDNPNTRLWPLGADLRGRPFQSMLVEFTQADLAAFGDWNRHQTDDMLHVLAGVLVLHTEGYAPVTLHPGDTVHFDGTMPHACLRGGADACRCLYVFAPR